MAPSILIILSTPPTNGAMMLPTLAHIEAEPSPTLRTFTAFHNHFIIYSNMYFHHSIKYKIPKLVFKKKNQFLVLIAYHCRKYLDGVKIDLKI